MYCSTEQVEGTVVDVKSLHAHLHRLTDLRDRRGIRYPLGVALTMITLAKLAGEDKVSGMADWLGHRAEWITGQLGLKRRTTPHETTISRILANAVDASELDRMVGEFLSSCTMTAEEGAFIVIALDGKTLRGTIPVGQTQGLHLLAAYLPQQGLVLMQLAVDSKENEILVAPQLIDMLDVDGAVVVGDAMHTQAALSAQIVENGGDYLWPVKENQPKLHAAIERLFTEQEMRPGFHAVSNDFRTATAREKGHGRLETRTLTASSMLNDYLDWPAVGQVLQLKRRTIKLNTGEILEDTSYGITSLTEKMASPRQLLTVQRMYWGIENGLHYRRDVTFMEDNSRLSSWHAQHAMAAINNLVIGLMSRIGVQRIPNARRRFCAKPIEAIRLITQPP
jgi:predicted transposase YbfD/YdcC